MANLSVPTPSPLPSPSNSPYSLSERINIATRSTHSQLNRLIITRLPLALPPHTSNPSTYISGLMHIAPIYITFETAWQSILDAGRPSSILRTRSSPLDTCDPDDLLISNEQTLPLVHATNVCSRKHSILSHLLLPGLLRAGRLRADIRILTGTPEHRIDEQLQTVSENGTLAEFVTHTKKAVEANPHVLLAYAWVLYMALFSGGRYLRALLQEAGGKGGQFWERNPSPVRPYDVTGDPGKRRRASRSESDLPKAPWVKPRSRSLVRSEGTVSEIIPGLQFFNFQGDEDGEDLKLEFKKRILEAELLLTEAEKDDIIAEAQTIFKSMVVLVGELDKVMGRDQSDGASEDIEAERLQTSRLNMSVRDSIIVTSERLSKKKRTPSDIDEEEKPKVHIVTSILSSPAKMARLNAASPGGMRSKSTQNRVSFSPDLNDDVKESNLISHLFSTAFLPVLAAVLLWAIWNLM